jgi:hypothetical protein
MATLNDNIPPSSSQSAEMSHLQQRFVAITLSLFHHRKSVVAECYIGFS